MPDELLPQPEARHIEDRQCRLRIDDLIGPDHLERPRQSYRHEFDELVAFAGVRSARQPRREEDVDLLIGESRRREHREHVLEALRRTARLLAQFAPRAVLGRLLVLQPPRRHFEDEAFRGVPVLPDQEQLRIVAAGFAQDRYDRAGPGMPDHLDLAGAPVGESHTVDIQADHASGVLPLAVDLAGCGRVHRAHGARGAPSRPYSTTGPKPSASSGPRIAAASPTTTSCSASGRRCFSAAARTSEAVTPRTWSR